MKIGERFRTGSSIMPKKRNPDILELVRGKVNIVTSNLNQVVGTIKTLPSGYQRDLQETKEPLMKSLRVTIHSIDMVTMAILDITVNKERLLNSFTSGIFATDEAFKLVSQGMPFRDAYKHVDYNFQKYNKESPEEIIKKRVYKGTTGNLGILNIKKKIDREMASSKARGREFRSVIDRLLKP